MKRWALVLSAALLALSLTACKNTSGCGGTGGMGAGYDPLTPGSAR